MAADDTGSAGPELDALAAELTARGLAEHGDFYIRGRLPNTVPSSENVGIRTMPDGSFKVWYRDMGEQRVLLETSDFAEARERFVSEATQLARERGRILEED